MFRFFRKMLKENAKKPSSSYKHSSTSGYTTEKTPEAFKNSSSSNNSSNSSGGSFGDWSSSFNSMADNFKSDNFKSDNFKPTGSSRGMGKSTDSFKNLGTQNYSYKKSHSSNRNDWRDINNKFFWASTGIDLLLANGNIGSRNRLGRNRYDNDYDYPRYDRFGNRLYGRKRDSDWRITLLIVGGFFLFSALLDPGKKKLKRNEVRSELEKRGIGDYEFAKWVDDYHITLFSEWEDEKTGAKMCKIYRYKNESDKHNIRVSEVVMDNMGINPNFRDVSRDVYILISEMNG